MYPFSNIVPGADLTAEWKQYLSRVDKAVFASESYGPTANRPTKGVQLGQFYFDATLGYPVWAKTFDSTGVTWVDATGATV